MRKSNVLVVLLVTVLFALIATPVLAAESVNYNVQSDVIEDLRNRGIQVYELRNADETRLFFGSNVDSNESVEPLSTQNGGMSQFGSVTLRPNSAIVVESWITIRAGGNLDINLFTVTDRTPWSWSTPPIGQVHVYGAWAHNRNDIWFHWWGPSGRATGTVQLPRFLHMFPIPYTLPMQIIIANYDSNYSITVNGSFVSR